ncbi:MAG: DUF1844 domain-containing protein [Candidatus Krumholzibacteriota bacterium]|nr:DUF1844 domain-containing protein [Candidatus Krumholzibacteriota bacterium]
MNENVGEDHNREGYLFHHLVAMFQSLALQQMGKLINPISGEVEGDLQQAKITIDMLEMIQMKTEGNLEENEKQLLDRIIMELQMNYVEALKTKDIEDESENAEDVEEDEEEDENKTEKESESKSESESKEEKESKE